MNQGKNTLQLQRLLNITKNAGLGYMIIVLFLVIPVLIGIYNDYQNDFAGLDLIFTHTHPVVIGMILTLSSFILGLGYLRTTTIKKMSLTLDNQGIRYYSGMPLGIGEDWNLSWDDIQEIRVTPLGEIIFISNIRIFGNSYRVYRTNMFQWLDKTTHQNVQKIDASILTRDYTPERYEAILNHVPLYRYFVENQIEIKIPKELSLSDKISTSSYTPLAESSLYAFLFMGNN